MPDADVARGADSPGGRRPDRGHVGHGGGAGDALLRVRRPVDSPAGAIDRHRREDAEQRERFRPVFAAPGEPQGDEFRAARRRLRRPRSSERSRRARAEADGRRPAGRAAAKRPASSSSSSNCPIRSGATRRRRRCPRPIPSPPIRPRKTVFDPAKEQHTGVVLGIAMASFRTSDRRRQVPHRARRRREARLSHGRPAAEDRQRQLHDRRLLREQDERIRRHLRLRADPQVARAARHDRPHDRRGPGQRHSDQAQAGRRRRDGPRQARKAAFREGMYRRRDLARPARAAAGRRANGKTASSTSCCS